MKYADRHNAGFIICPRASYCVKLKKQSTTPLRVTPPKPKPPTCLGVGPAVAGYAGLWGAGEEEAGECGEGWFVGIFHTLSFGSVAGETLETQIGVLCPRILDVTDFT
jgi:hypothetical protein